MSADISENEAHNGNAKFRGETEDGMVVVKEYKQKLNLKKIRSINNY